MCISKIKIGSERFLSILLDLWIKKRGFVEWHLNTCVNIIVCQILNYLDYFFTLLKLKRLQG